MAVAPDAVLEALLRVMVGGALVPHGLRIGFGFFRGTGLTGANLKALVAQLDRDGYRPGRLWAPLISITQLIAGPLLASGLFTRAAALTSNEREQAIFRARASACRCTIAAASTRFCACGVTGFRRRTMMRTASERVVGMPFLLERL